MVPSGEPSNDTVLPELIAICGADFARPAGSGDTVAEVPARWVAAPGSVTAVAETMRLAARHGWRWCRAAQGTKLDWGALARPGWTWCWTPGGWPASGSTRRRTWSPRSARVRRCARCRRRWPGRAAARARPALPGRDHRRCARHRRGRPAAPSVRRPAGAADPGQLRAGGRTVTGSAGRIARSATGQDRPGCCSARTARSACWSPRRSGCSRRPLARIWVTRPVWTPLEVHDLVGEVLAGRLAPAAIEVDLPAAAAADSQRIAAAGARRRPGGDRPRAERAAAVARRRRLDLRRAAPRLVGAGTRSTAWGRGAAAGRAHHRPARRGVRAAGRGRRGRSGARQRRARGGARRPARRHPPERVAAILTAVRGVLLARRWLVRGARRAAAGPRGGRRLGRGGRPGPAPPGQAALRPGAPARPRPLHRRPLSSARAPHHGPARSPPRPRGPTRVRARCAGRGWRCRRGVPRRRSSIAVDRSRAATTSAGVAGQRRGRVAQPVDAEQLPAPPPLGHPVGVEDQRVARVPAAILVGGRGDRVEQAERGAAGADEAASGRRRGPAPAGRARPGAARRRAGRRRRGPTAASASVQ